LKLTRQTRWPRDRSAWATRSKNRAASPCKTESRGRGRRCLTSPPGWPRCRRCHPVIKHQTRPPSRPVKSPRWSRRG
jgi:hypothetical protein